MLDSHARTDGTTTTPRSASRGGPAHPTPDAIAALRPLGLDAVRLDAGSLLGQWQGRNTTATLPHCVAQLDRSGALDNVRRLRTNEKNSDQNNNQNNNQNSDGRPFVGMWFADSDIYKTLEAAAWELARPQPTTEARDFLDTTAALLAEVQEPDGYLNSYFVAERTGRRWRELSWSHELYCAGHLIQAAVAAARVGAGAAGDALLGVARRLADLLVDRFGPGGVDAVCGHPLIETALVELFRTTGHRPYLDLAKRFVELRGHGLLGEVRFGPAYLQDHVPVRDATEVTGHAVRQLYLLAGMVDVAVETGDVSLLDSARRLWDSAFRTRTYVTGAHGSRHRDEAFGDPYELPPDRAYAETCAAIASFQWNWRMLLADGERRYADEMERALYNAIAVSPALNGTHFFYSNPLQLRTGHDGSGEDAPAQRLPWYSCACCPPNLARLMASLQAYVATEDDAGLQIHLYSAGTIRATIHGRPVEVAISGGYPWDGRVVLDIRADSPEPWTLALRIPGWCVDFAIEINGLPQDSLPQDNLPRDGYLRLTRDWTAATVILELSMPPRLVAAHPNVDAVRGCLAVLRGPLVYCLEQADLPAGVVLEDVRLDPAEPPWVAGSVPAPAAGGATGPAGAVTIAGRATVRSASSPALYRDATTHAATNSPTPSPTPPNKPPTPIPLTVVPYFLWGNRTAGPMRVWIPTDPSLPPSEVQRANEQPATEQPATEQPTT
jgi:DUF1680 family protein